MPDLARPTNRAKKASKIVISSYVLDWVILIVVGVIGYYLGEKVTPNKRHFSLQDPNISFPVTENETVNTTFLLVYVAAVPIGVILLVALLLVPGRTVPRGTPQSLIWKRKLWELHMGWLGLALSIISAWIITQGMKNLFGKPRPDLLNRCQPDVANVMKYIVGFNTPSDDGTLSGPYNGQLVSAAICKNPDKAFLDDGFRSYPSGHSSSSAAGLIYLSFFLASKFAINLPFVPHENASRNSSAISAFPSRIRHRNHSPHSSNTGYGPTDEDVSSPLDPSVTKQIGVHNATVQAIRQQAAAPPVYLLLLAILPFFLAVFIASSRWFDFRHHGFDILFGFIIGTITAYFSFRYYHMPTRSGGGWAWGPRSRDKAYWAGVGSYTYASDVRHWERPGDEEEGFTRGANGMNNGDIELGTRRRDQNPRENRQHQGRGV
ncbi:PAP2 superfamily-domain-containing protein [Xylariaceae sp. FL1019]|nr:PAP2 superfamily-domain-containing protein [Xylariaceae sp. FL1019]